ncbi:MAG: Nramp family divalent metal transporter [Bacillota bacterium]
MAVPAVPVVPATSAAAVALPRGRAFVRFSRLAAFLGPAFVVSVAYMDPGNFATNLSAGSNFSYGLVWVALWSNLMAIFLQTLSAKLGIATGKTLPQLCAELFSPAANWFLWGVAELAAMATNVAEFLGGALGFYLLFHVPLVWAGLLTGVCSLVITGLDRYGQKAVELAISALVGVISLSYVLEIFLASPDWGQVAFHTLVPSLGRDSILVAVGMLGATVMPHVIFLHSQLVLSRRNACGGLAGLRRHLRMEKIDVAVAMNVAFLINASMVVVAAAVFHTQGMSVTSIEQAHISLAPLLGAFSGTAFAVALLASGLSSSAVGTMAGQCVMQGFGCVRLGPLWERLLAMIPAMAVIAAGLDPVRSLILSQVSLSFALPFAVIPLLVITGRRQVMGPFTNTRLTSIAGCVVAGAIIGINLLLLYLTIFT